MHKMGTAGQPSMGTWEFHKMGSGWNENRQCWCPDESPPEQIYFLILFLQKSDSYHFFLSFLSTVLTIHTLNAHATPYSHSLDI